MYKKKDHHTTPLFEEIFPFGGKLNPQNRWLKIAELIPWEKLEQSYSQLFSHTGRPARDARLVNGLLLLKHLTNTSDSEIVQLVSENPYMQAFCGLEQFLTGKLIDPSTLTNVRKRLGVEKFQELEKLTYQTLINRKIIKPKGVLVDATVFPENICYPTDIGILNKCRQWLVDKTKSVGAKIGQKFRTYCRKARKVYLDFNKKKRKTEDEVRRVTKSLLQYTQRNLRQFEEAATKSVTKGLEIPAKVTERLAVVKETIRQQQQMLANKVHQIENRIVSLHKPQVRPIKRGKLGKETEFGPKASLSHIGCFTFLDRFSSDNYNESGDVALQLADYQAFFGKLPPYMVGDRIYGTTANRKLLSDNQIRDAFEPRGRKPVNNKPEVDWRRRKRRERNRIEGSFGNLKNHFGLNRIRYSIAGGDELYVRLGLMAANLKAVISKKPPKRKKASK